MGAHFIFALLVSAVLASCAPNYPSEDIGSAEEPLFFECGNGLRYPTTELEFQNVYAGRVFYAPGGAGRHLGHDIEYPEGTPVRAIACGRLVVYRYATGYGTLATVVEHHLSRRVTVHNGLNEEVSIDTFLSIQGHLRTTSGRGGTGVHTGLREGMMVVSGQILGYVEHRDLNGDGDEHDHFGIRLGSYAEALRVHPSSPFRGYDVSGDGRRYFADPAIFMREIIESHPVLWHPPGTLLVNREDRSQRWLVGAGDTIHPVDETYLTRERLWGREVGVSPAELDCYRRGTAPPYETWLSTLIRFDDSSAVYESGMYRLTRDRHTFISYEAFLSWGWTDSRVERWSSSRRPSFFASTTDRGFRRMRDGTLVKARGHPEVSIVSEGRRLPFFNWETFIAMGYDPDEIVEVDPSVIDDVAYPRGGMITPELARLCRVPSCSGSRCDGAGMSGGGGVDPPPDDASVPMPPDAGTPPTPGCLVDRDCLAYSSGWRCRSGTCREVDIDGDGYLESTGDCNVDVARFHPGATEICDRQDDDCDGSIDETFDFSSDPLNCGSCGRSCASGEVCTSGVCTATCVPSTETCDGRDQDCDGTVDEGVCAPPPPVTDPNLVRIRLVEPRAECPAGWRIKLWLSYPAEESPRGGTLERSVTRSDGWSSITLWCDERSPPWIDFDLADGNALGTGIFAELSMGGVDLRSSTRICIDPAAPDSGYRPIIMWDPARRGTCPP